VDLSIGKLLLSVLVASSVPAAQITEGTSKVPNVLLPLFTEFKVTTRFRGKPAPAVLVRPIEQRFRTVLREGAKDGPNFAGHYTVVEWGCGTECFQAAIVDAETGRVYASPLQDPMEDFASSWLHFQTNSSLLIACVNCRKWAREQCDQKYFVWEGDRFKTLDRSPRSDPHSH
jgi:hypothetical protein